MEGGNVASDVWVLEHMKPSIFVEPSGDADDVYHRFEGDLALAASLGFNAHRLSIEWSRIEPEPGQISLAELAYYRRVLEACHRHGLAPVVTFNHYTVPRWFAAAGGFETEAGIEPFVRYCETVTQHLGELITVAATFNEPNINALLSWSPAIQKMLPMIAAFRKAATQAGGSAQWSSPMLADFRVQQPILIQAHAKAYDAITRLSQGRFPVGVTLSLTDDRPADGSGGVERKRAQVLTPWLQAPGDFVGVQVYTSAVVGANAELPPTAGVELTQMGYPYAPEALEGVIRMVAQQTRRPIYVTENGIATEDDTRRIAFIRGAVDGMLKCIADGIDVRGYMHWSLLDNWEWTSGYRPKFGLVEVDRTTFARTPKPSANYLGQIARKGKIA
ncbi:beta-glucosidase [Dyella flava]|nr:beta-glucosidase [Dyella flava]